MKNSTAKISSSLQNLAGVYSIKNKVPEFEKAKEYLNALSEKLIMIEKISNRINKERQGKYSFLSFGTIF